MTMEAQWIKKVELLANDVPDNAWIAGGCLRSLLVGDPVKDVDIFSNDPESVISFFESKDGFVKTFGNDFFQNFKKGEKIFQVIKKYKYESPQETIDNFDFTCISAAYGKDGFICNERFYLDNAQKRLVINSLPLPLSTLKRSFKYATKGYILCPVSMSRLVRTINELKVDWDNPDENQIDFYPDGTPTFRGKD